MPLLSWAFRLLLPFCYTSLQGLQCPWWCGSALIAAVVRAGQGHRAELLPALPWHCPPAALLPPRAVGEEPFGCSCVWLNHSQQQSVTCIKLPFCRQCAHFPCVPWLCKLCAHWALWVWCCGFQREAWLFSQSHFLHVFCGWLHYLILKHILYSFVNNLIIHIYVDAVPFCLSCQFLFPSVISQIADECTEGNYASPLDFCFLQKPRPQLIFSVICFMTIKNWFCVSSVLPDNHFHCADRKLTRFTQAKFSLRLFIYWNWCTLVDVQANCWDCVFRHFYLCCTMFESILLI